MTNVITFQPKPTPTGQPDLIDNLETLMTYAARAKRTVAGARSLDTCLRYYADFLRRYYELDGCVKTAWRAMEAEIQVHGNEVDIERISCAVERLANAEACAKGPHPWLSLPDHSRFQRKAEQTVDVLRVEIGAALSIIRMVGKTGPFQHPKGAA